MADQKVSDLPSLNGADVDAADLLYIVDSSAGTAGSKKITIGQYQLAPVSGGTANGVLYLNASKVLTSGSALTFDGTNFATTGTVTATKLVPTGNVTAGNGMYLPAANTLAWSTNGAEGMRLDASGNLGLGVTPSAWGASGNLQLDTGRNISAGTGIGLYGNAYFNAGWKYIDSTGASGYGQSAGQHAWFTAPSGTAGNAITFTQAMTLDASGNLGVGTTSPDAKLDVAGTALVGLFGSESANNAYIGFKYNSTILGYVGNGSGVSGGSAATEFSIGSTGARALTFGTNDLERARITSGGDLLVGTTSGTGRITSYSGGSAHALIAETNAYEAATFVNNTNSYYVQSNWSKATTGNNLFVDFGTEGTYTSRGYIDYNRAGGQVRYNTTSDYRLKTFVAKVTGSGQRIDALNPVEFEWKENGNRARGFFAHEFQQVYASSVSGEKDAVDAEGKPVYQAMQASTAEVIADLVAEIQSLRARVAALEAA